MAVLAFLGLCPAFAEVHAQDGRWIRIDPRTQRYDISAREVSRGELLADLAKLSRVEVRPGGDPSEKVTLQAKGLELEELLARILPRGTRYALRLGQRDAAAAEGKAKQGKQGPRVEPPQGSGPKRPGSTGIVKTGNLKPPATSLVADHPAIGANTKAPAQDLVRLAEIKEPKKAAGGPATRETVRLTLRFDQGKSPAVIEAQTVEGKAPVQRVVSGPYLYVVVDANSQPIEYGTILDPLEEHSYLPAGQHSVGRAQTGVIGISIARSNLSAANLLIIEISSLAISGELTDGVVRAAIARGKTIATVDLKQVVRILDQGATQ
jgi:hypothetical protein